MNPRLRQLGTALALLLAAAVAGPAPAAPAATHRAARPHALARPDGGRTHNVPPPGNASLANVISPGVSVQRGSGDGGSGSGSGSEYAVSPGVSVEKQTANGGGSTDSSLFAVSPGVSIEKLTATGGGGTDTSEFVVSPGVSVEKLTANGGGSTDSSLFVVSPGVSVEKLTTAGGATDTSLFVLSPGVSVQRTAVGGYTLTTTITGGPAEGAAVCDSSATFTFAASSTDPSPSFVFVYRVDGGPWQGPIKNASVTLGPLGDGSHTFEVAAIDELGNEDPNPAKRTFTVDTQPPSILRLSAVPTVTGATVTWATDKPATSQVEYQAQGTTDWIKSPLDSSLVTAHSVTLSGLTPATVYAYRARSADSCGQESVSVPLAFTTVQDTPPTTTITGGPADGATVCDSTATFTFTGSDAYTPVAALRYEYRLDGGAWSAPAPATTATFPGLADGAHTFEVAAVNEAGEVDPRPAKHTFIVDALPPTISALAAGSPTLTGATITWTTDRPATSQVDYRVSGTTDWTSTTLDRGLVTAHTVTLSGLLPGSAYDFRAHSIDACGHETISSALAFTLIADTIPPDTSLTSGPADGATVCSADVIFSFTGTDNYTQTANLRYQYRVDGGAWSAIQVAATVSLTGLSDGAHTFAVAAVDEAGNVDATPALVHFIVDTVPPVVSALTAAQALTSATVTWTTDKPATSSVTYRVQGTVTWSSSGPDTTLLTAHRVALTGLQAGMTYEYQAHSTDACGHETVSAVQTFSTVADTTPPTTAITAGPADGSSVCALPVTFTWTGADDVTPTDQLTYSWQLDTGGWSPFAAATTQTFPSLADGAHIFLVRARDAAGNIDLNPATRRFNVSTAPPVITAVMAAPRDYKTDCYLDDGQARHLPGRVWPHHRLRIRHDPGPDPGDGPLRHCNGPDAADRLPLPREIERRLPRNRFG